MIITAAILRRKKACSEQVALFIETFGPKARVEITEALCAEHAQKFNWDWAAENLLPPPLYADYRAKLAPLYADYSAKLAPLYADYAAKCAPLVADYEDKCAVLFGRLATKGE